MATVTYIGYTKQSAATAKGVCEYVSQEQKTMQENGIQLVSSQNCSPQFAVQEFTATRQMHRKKSPVWFYHYVQSFHPDEPITGQQAHTIAKEFAAQTWPDSEVLIAIHVDADRIHSHFIVNAVCLESGKMLRQGPNTLKSLRKISDELCQIHSLSMLPLRNAGANARADPGSGAAADRDPTGWETEREAFLTSKDTPARASVKSVVADAPAGLGSIVGDVIQLGYNMERLQQNRNAGQLSPGTSDGIC